MSYDKSHNVHSQMKSMQRKQWEILAITVSELLEHSQIRYHFDASTALYLHGIEFEMDDLDVTVEWGRIEDARKVLEIGLNSSPTVESENSLKFQVEERVLHVMTFQSDTGIGAEEDRILVPIADTRVWSKTVDFIFRHTNPSHALYKQSNNYINSRNETPVTQDEITQQAVDEM